jgi:hypothetical protein
VSFHSLLTQSEDYLQEDKWTFLTSGKANKVPVSPYWDHIPALVCKNKNIEGGMGIFFYKSAAFGGDWIIQVSITIVCTLTFLLSNFPCTSNFFGGVGKIK